MLAFSSKLPSFVRYHLLLEMERVLFRKSTLARQKAAKSRKEGFSQAFLRYGTSSRYYLPCLPYPYLEGYTTILPRSPLSLLSLEILPTSFPVVNTYSVFLHVDHPPASLFHGNSFILAVSFGSAMKFDAYKAEQRTNIF